MSQASLTLMRVCSGLRPPAKVPVIPFSSKLAVTLALLSQRA